MKTDRTQAVLARLQRNLFYLDRVLEGDPEPPELEVEIVEDEKLLEFTLGALADNLLATMANQQEGKDSNKEQSTEHKKND